jgi:hypothetical protein
MHLFGFVSLSLLVEDYTPSQDKRDDHINQNEDCLRPEQFVLKKIKEGQNEWWLMKCISNIW